MKTSLVAAISLLIVGCNSVNQPARFGTTGHDDSNTANSISTLNPNSTSYANTSYPSQLYNFAASEDANRYYEQGFGNAVSTKASANACLGTTGAGLTMTPVSCVAYNAGYRGTETGSITFPNSSTCWVAMDENTSGSNANLPNFTRAGATHYLTDCIDATQPAMASDSQLLMKVVTSGGSITAVSDLRKTGVQMTSGAITGSGANATLSGFSVNGVLNAAVYGAVGDAIYSGDGTHAADGTVTGGGTTLISPTGAFSSALVGDLVFVDGGGLGGTLYAGTVTTVNSSTSLTINPNTSAAITGTAHYVIGHDNTTALQNWINAARNSTPPNMPQLYLPNGNYLHRGLDFSEINGLNLEGAGGTLIASTTGVTGVTGGSALIGVSPTNSNGGHPTVCHDFTGDGELTVRNLAFRSGTSTQEACAVNVLTDRLNGTYFGILNEWIDDVFQAFGTYDLVDYGAEQTSVIDSVINFNLDPAIALYLSVSNSPGFQSPTRGALITAPNSTTIFHVLGGKSQISSNGNPGIVFDNRDNFSLGHPVAMYTETFDGAYMRPNAAGAFITDTCTVNCNSNASYGLKTITFRDIQWEPQAATSQIISIAAPALNWLITGNSYQTAASLTADQMTFTNGLVDSIVQFDGQVPGTNHFINASSCIGSILQLGNPAPASVNSACQNNALAVTTDNGMVQLGGSLMCGSGVTPSVSGGGTLATGSTGFTGVVTSIAATGNVLTPGCTCPNAVTAVMTDSTSGAAVSYTAATTTTITFSGTATHNIHYITSCR